MAARGRPLAPAKNQAGQSRAALASSGCAETRAPAQFDDLAERLLHIPNACPRSAPSTRHNRNPTHKWLVTVTNPKWIRTLFELSTMKIIA